MQQDPKAKVWQYAWWGEGGLLLMLLLLLLLLPVVEMVEGWRGHKCWCWY